MDVVKVVIENWPKTNNLSVFIPVIIAIIALCISLYSIYLTRKIFVESHWPYVWASNYNSKYFTPLAVACHVINSPARIIQMELKMNLNMKTLSVHTERDMVRFPDEMYEWSFDMSMDDFDKIRTRTYEAKSKLVRLVSLKYSSLMVEKYIIIILSNRLFLVQMNGKMSRKRQTSLYTKYYSIRLLNSSNPT